MRNLLASLSIVALTPLAMAAGAPVEDLSARQAVGTTPGMSSAPRNATGDLYYQVQVLQEEVRDLRGMVDEQANELRRLRQQQMDDYQDLDRRIGGGFGQSETPADAPRAQMPMPEDSPPATDDLPARLPSPGGQGSEPGADSEAERRSYDAAYELLKNRSIEQAVVSFKEHLQRFPDGPYAANAHYWLGEIYLLQNNLPEANLAFSEVVTSFPAHRKVTDAKFKLGRVLHLQGQNERARALLQEVAATDSTAADLARNYLAENF